MPIRLNLERVMAEREISLTELADRVGLTLANLSILKTNKAKAVRFSTLKRSAGSLSVNPETCWNSSKRNKARRLSAAVPGAAGQSAEFKVALSAGRAIHSSMSFAEIISELPKLTREQRASVLERLAALDQGLWVDVTIPADERKEIDWRLAEDRAGGVTWSNWDEAKARIQGKLNPD